MKEEFFNKGWLLSKFNPENIEVYPFIIESSKERPNSKHSPQAIIVYTQKTLTREKRIHRHALVD